MHWRDGLKNAQTILERTALRVLMTVLILISISPLPHLDELWWVFFSIFALELTIRVTAIVMSRRPRPGELFVLVLDLVATISFLPLEAFSPQARLLRLARLAALLGYWLPYFRDLLNLTLRPERWRQLAFVAAAVLVLCTVSALLVTNFAVPLDTDLDGVAERPGFFGAFWWAFLQIESPDNLARLPSPGLAFALSVILTLSGFFVFSFFIGIGASLVSELVDTSRLTPVGFRHHVAVLNPSPDCELLLRELFSYYRKQFQVPKVAVLGSSPEVPEFLRRREIRRTRYRTGAAAESEHLSRVDVAEAKRVVVLKNVAEGITDAEVVATVLTVRELNPECNIYAEVKRAESASAAIVAGGPRTHAVLTQEFQGLILANLIIFPGMRPLLEELVSSAGREIYTCVYGMARMAQHPPQPVAGVPDFGRLVSAAYREHQVVLVGGFGCPGPDTPIEGRPFIRCLPHQGDLQGLIGIADHFPKIRDLATELARGRLPGVEAAEPRAIGRFGLPPRDREFDRVLVCGFRQQTSILLEQLALYSDHLDVTILLPDAPDLERARETLLRPTLWGLAKRRVAFRESGQDTLTAHLDDDSAIGRVRLVRGDWSMAHDLKSHVFDHDVVVVTSEPDAHDPDARTATGLLKLASILTEAPDRVPDHFRVVGEVQDQVKEQVLTRRFGEVAVALHRRGLSIDLVSLDSLRSQFLAQSLMVPGITEVLGELLSQGAEQFVRLVPLEPLPSGELTFGDLLDFFTAEGSALPVAVEIEGRVCVGPAPEEEGHRFDARQLSAVYAVAPLLEGAGVGLRTRAQA